MTNDYTGPERRFKKGTIRDRRGYDWTKVQPIRASDLPKLKKTPQEKRPRVTSHLTPEEIKSIRKRAGMTQTKFGEAIGVSKTTVYQWEHGDRKPSRMAEKLILEIGNNPTIVDF